MMLEKLPRKLKLVKNGNILPKTPITFEKSYQTIAFPNGQSAQLLTAPPDASPEQTAFKLPCTTPKSLIMVSGEAKDIEPAGQQRLTQLFSRGIARAAVNLDAVLMDNGKTSELVAITGQSVADRGYKSPLIGVTSAMQVTYPGQSAAPDQATPLDPNHSHFVLVETQYPAQEIAFRYQLGAAVATKKPAVTILVNGGEQSRAELLLRLAFRLAYYCVVGYWAISR